MLVTVTAPPPPTLPPPPHPPPQDLEAALAKLKAQLGSAEAERSALEDAHDGLGRKAEELVAAKAALDAKIAELKVGEREGRQRSWWQPKQR